MSTSKRSPKISKNQDLIALRQDLKAAQIELKQFRRDVAILKKSGLIGKNYDARKITPTKYLNEQIKKFSDVIFGGAKAVKVNKKNEKYYREKGYKTKNQRVIVPVSETEKIYSRAGNFYIKNIHHTGEITIVDKGFDKNNINNWRRDVESLKLKSGERLAFQIGGYNTYQSNFRGAKELLDYLEYYPNFQSGGESTLGMIEAIVIFKVKRNIELPENVHAPEDIARFRSRDAARQRRYINSLDDEQYARYREKRRIYQANRRERLSEAQREKEAQKKRERMKKLYENRKKERSKK